MSSGDIPPYRFILTKWYVKTSSVGCQTIILKGFILTKWYVKTDLISK